MVLFDRGERKRLRIRIGFAGDQTIPPMFRRRYDAASRGDAIQKHQQVQLRPHFRVTRGGPNTRFSLVTQMIQLGSTRVSVARAKEMGPRSSQLKKFTADHDLICSDCMQTSEFIREGRDDFVVCATCGHRLPVDEASASASCHVTRQHLTLILPFFEKWTLETAILRRRLAPCHKGYPKFIYRAWADVNALKVPDPAILSIGSLRGLSITMTLT